MEFKGYRRRDGGVGIRNLVAVIASTGCINEVPSLACREIQGAVPMGHNLSCSHLGEDLKRSVRTIVNLCGNPNLYGVVLVGMGCEQMTAEDLYERARGFEKPLELFTLQKEGDWDMLVRRARDATERMARKASELKREEAKLGELTLGIKCGGSDTTSGLISNPVAGFAADLLIEANGTVIFTETPEILGAEQVLAKRTTSREAAAKLLDVANRTEQRIKAMGVDLRGSEPTPANMQGGLTTIEEKSLGAIVKGGTAPIRGVLQFGERPAGRGLFFMDGPARTAELMLGVAAAGCQLMIFSSGGGLPALLPVLPAAPARFQVLPVIKMSGNPSGIERFRGNLDIYVGTIAEGKETIPQAGERLVEEILRVASGEGRPVAEKGTYVEPLLFPIDGPAL
jgi:altronate dehydratase large subunit